MSAGDQKCGSVGVLDLAADESAGITTSGRAGEDGTCQRQLGRELPLGEDSGDLDEHIGLGCDLTRCHGETIDDLPVPLI